MKNIWSWRLLSVAALLIGSLCASCTSNGGYSMPPPVDRTAKLPPHDVNRDTPTPIVKSKVEPVDYHILTSSTLQISWQPRNVTLQTRKVFFHLYCLKDNADTGYAKCVDFVLDPPERTIDPNHPVKFSIKLVRNPASQPEDQKGRYLLIGSYQEGDDAGNAAGAGYLFFRIK